MSFLDFHTNSYISATVHHTNHYSTLGWPVHILSSKNSYRPMRVRIVCGGWMGAGPWYYEMRHYLGIICLDFLANSRQNHLHWTIKQCQHSQTKLGGNSCWYIITWQRHLLNAKTILTTSGQQIYRPDKNMISEERLTMNGPFCISPKTWSMNAVEAGGDLALLQLSLLFLFKYKLLSIKQLDLHNKLKAAHPRCKNLWHSPVTKTKKTKKST